MLDKSKIENIKKDGLYSIREITEMFNLTRDGVNNWLRKGLIKKSRIGGRVYIKGEELLKLIKLWEE